MHEVIVHSPVLGWQYERRINAPSCWTYRKRVHGTASAAHGTKPSITPPNIRRIMNAAALLLDVDGINVRLASLDSDFLHGSLRGRGSNELGCEAKAEVRIKKYKWTAAEV